ncbi:unnamed protein product [Paramecium pentaurelia]|uniref:Uncharacterized protein n=1 Tax=Paramecium pentaurelia TaxID=43138 RepID=A0A8S1X099_9CILI|nr:unnamed protein product [Paramecium pentaurelia]
MINHQDQASFDDSRLQQEMKQTAQFFNPQLNSLGQSIKFQQKQIQRVPFKSPKEQAFKLSSDGKKNIQPQINVEKRPSQTLKKVTLAKSTKQFAQNNHITPVMHKFGSPPKLIKVPSVKPFSPPQPKTNNEQINILQNNSVAPGFQRNPNIKFGQPLKISDNEFNISMADLQPVRKHIPTKQTEDFIQPEYPSYQKSLLDSRQSQYNSEQMQKSNSTAFLPKINQTKKIYNNQLIGYGSIGQQSQQETALRTNSSKQTITPVNEFISFNLPNDDVARKSRTAQEHLRDSLESQNQMKQTYKIINMDKPDQFNQLPQIQSPQASTKQQFAFQSTGGSQKPKNFLQRTPQTKIISRLFSSKSDNNQII